MKHWLMTGLLAVSLGLALAPNDAFAKRLGAGKSVGMQRNTPATQPHQATPAQPAAPQATPAAAPTPAAAATPPKRNWMGPLAGLAAGLGIAALMSHFGMGEAMGNFLMMALLAVAAFALISFVTRRFIKPSGPTLATAGGAPTWNEPTPMARQAQQPNFGGSSASPALGAAPAAASLSAPSPAALPPGFDHEGFQRVAKGIFIRMQAAHDRADLDDLRSFTTPELFAQIKLDLMDRNNSAQTTDVVKVDAEVLELAQEGAQQIVTVRFKGLIREERDAPAADFDELWHLVRQGDAGSWAIAGIQQRQ